MDRKVHTVIDPKRCTGCGLCIPVCPSRTLDLVDGKAAVTGDESLNCGHCQAACPAGAVRVSSLPPESLEFTTFETGRRWMPHGEFDAGELVRLMRSRRSCRNYTDEPVDKAVLEDLVRVGVTAPSGTNSQKWTFTILPNREAVLEVARRVGDFFAQVNRMAEKAWLRGLMRLLGRPQLHQYYRDHYQSVREALEEWEQTGRERLFHGAPAAILVGSAPGASCPQEDALLAAGHILLAAHAMGLGSCLIGYVVEALRNKPELKTSLGVPAEEDVHAVIALGRPDEKYYGFAGRKLVRPRYFNPVGD